MTHPLVTRFSIDIFRDADLIDRQKLTHWLMRWSTPAGVSLDDFRGGRITMSGIEFSGSAVLVFDQFVSDMLWDFEDRWTRAAEDLLSEIRTADIQTAADHLSGQIVAARRKLLERATDIKRRLSKSPRETIRLLPSNYPPHSERLQSRVKIIADHRIAPPHQLGLRFGMTIKDRLRRSPL